MANANAVNNVHNNLANTKPTCSPSNGKKGGASFGKQMVSLTTQINNAPADSANTFSSFHIETPNVHIANSIAGSGNHNDTTGANSLPPSGYTSGGRLFTRNTKPTKGNNSPSTKRPRKSDPFVEPDRSKLKRSDPFVVPDGPDNLLNSATSAATHEILLPNLTEVSKPTSDTPDPTATNPITFESFYAKRRRLLSRPFATALANTNPLHHTTGGTIRASTSDVGPPAATSGLGSSGEMEWLTRMFHPPN